MESHEAMILKDFIEENWAAFQQRCDEQDVDPEKIVDGLNEIAQG